MSDPHLQQNISSSQLVPPAINVLFSGTDNILPLYDCIQPYSLDVLVFTRIIRRILCLIRPLMQGHRHRHNRASLVQCFPRYALAPLHAQWIRIIILILPSAARQWLHTDSHALDTVVTQTTTVSSPRLSCGHDHQRCHGSIIGRRHLKNKQQITYYLVTPLYKLRFAYRSACIKR